MRSDWVPVSASALVVGVMALVLGSLLNPTRSGESAAQLVGVVSEQGGRWLAMAVMFFGASVALILGLPSVISLFERRGRHLGMAAVAVFAVGVLGLCGYAMLMVFFRALAVHGALEGNARVLKAVTADKSFAIFLYGWVAGFYLGLFLLACALFVARSTPVWVPVLLLVFVAVLPASSHLPRVGQLLQLMALAAAFTGIAVAAVSEQHRRALVGAPAF